MPLLCLQAGSCQNFFTLTSLERKDKFDKEPYSSQSMHTKLLISASNQPHVFKLTGGVDLGKVAIPGTVE